MTYNKNNTFAQIGLMENIDNSDGKYAIRATNDTTTGTFPFGYSTTGVCEFILRTNNFYFQRYTDVNLNSATRTYSPTTLKWTDWVMDGIHQYSTEMTLTQGNTLDWNVSWHLGKIIYGEVKWGGLITTITSIVRSNWRSYISDIGYIDFSYDDNNLKLQITPSFSGYITLYTQFK